MTRPAWPPLNPDDPGFADYATFDEPADFEPVARVVHSMTEQPPVRVTLRASGLSLPHGEPLYALPMSTNYDDMTAGELRMLLTARDKEISSLVEAVKQTERALLGCLDYHDALAVVRAALSARRGRDNNRGAQK